MSMASVPSGFFAWRALLPAWCALVGSGCNIVQGFQEAGDSLFPEQSSHLAAPGIRLLSGNYRGLGVAAGSELFLLARGADDDSGKLYVMRYAEPRPCEIPRVIRFYSTRDASRPAPLFAYLEEDVRRGQLHFADTTCQTYDLTFEDARLPVAETKEGLIVWAGTDLWLATPETGGRKLLASGVESVSGGMLGDRFAVRANGNLTLFDATWQELGTFGEAVTGLIRAGRSLFYEDKAGVHRIRAEGDSRNLRDDLLVEAGCSIGTQDGVWVTLRSPCLGGKVDVIHEPSGRVFALQLDAEPTQTRLLPARGSPGQDPLIDPFWFFYLRGGGTGGATNTLLVRTPAGEEHALGTNATLEQLRLVETANEVHGYALVDVVGETGRYLWWNAEGDTRELATGAMWRPRRLIINSDGSVGDLAVTSGDRLEVLAERVPWQAFEYQDGTQAWTVLFRGLEGPTGRLSVLPSNIDELQGTPLSSPFAAPPLNDIAQNVVAFSTLSLDRVLSGVIYVKDPDVTTRTGRLEYRNLDLRFTASVSDGVSDYLVADDEVLYAVPYGENSGIWLAPGK